MRVLILHDEVGAGARKDEQDVLVQAGVVRGALEGLGHEVVEMGFGLDLAGAAEGIRAARPEVVFNLVESVAGTGRLIHLAPSLLDALGVPYTGAPAEAMFQTSSKLCGKRVLRGAGLATPAWFTLEELRAGVEVPAGRYIVKSVWEHASVGLDEESVVNVEDGGGLLSEVEKRLEGVLGEGFAEAYVEGREFNLGLIGGGGWDRGILGSWDQGEGIAKAVEEGREVREPSPGLSQRERGAEEVGRKVGEEETRGFGPERPHPRRGGGCRALPPAEILFEGYGEGKARVVGYRAKWEEGSFEYVNTPRRFEFGAEDGALLREMEGMARACWDVFGLRGYARVDFRVDGAGRPWILEVNTNPCLSPDAGFAAAMDRAGMGIGEAVGRIVAQAGCRGGTTGM